MTSIANEIWSAVSCYVLQCTLIISLLPFHLIEPYAAIIRVCNAVIMLIKPYCLGYPARIRIAVMSANVMSTPPTLRHY